MKINRDEQKNQILILNKDKIYRNSFISKNKHSFPKSLFLIIILSLFLNICGIWWGLPNHKGWAPDEVRPSLVISGIQNSFSHGWRNKYPPFHFYTLALSYSPIIMLHRLHVLDVNNYEIYNILFFIGRFISVLMGTSIIFIVYLCGREIYGERESLFAALITALIAPFIYYSKIVNMEIPYIFWFTLSLLFFVRILKNHRIADYLLFSATAVLSVCTKDQAYGFYVLIPACIVLSNYLYIKRKNRTSKIASSFINRKMLLSLTLAVLLFFVIHNILFNMEGFIKHFKLVTGPVSVPYKMYDLTISGYSSMLWHSIKNIRFSIGWPLFLTCIVGLLLTILKRKKDYLLLWILIPGISYYLFFISVVLINYVRFLIPICIILSFFGGKFLSDFLGSTHRLYKTKIVIVSMIFIYSFLYSTSIDILMVKDSRYKVESLIKQNINPNKSIVLFGKSKYLPRMRYFNQIKYIPKPNRKHLSFIKPDYFILNSDFTKKFKNKTLYFKPDKGKLAYRLILQYRYNPPWILLNHRNIYKNNKKVISTNLDKINPEIKIFKRIK